MSNMRKKINREVSRKPMYKGKIKIGCFLMALSLAVLNPGVKGVYADSNISSTDTEKTDKKTVSENKAKSEADKKKSQKEKSGVKQAETEKPEKSQTVQETSVPQETSAAQVSEAPQKAEETGTPDSEKDTEAKEQPDEKTDTPAAADTDEESKGPEESGEEGGSAPETKEQPEETGSTDDEVQADNSQGEGISSPETGAVAGQEEPAQPSYVQNSDAGDGQELIEEVVEPVPVVGLIEGASTIIVGGLMPSVPNGDQGQEPVNQDAEDVPTEADSQEEDSNNEEEQEQEAQSRIAGSTPLVGGVIVGESTPGSSEKETTPTATPSPTPSSAGGSAGSYTATKAVPSPSIAQQDSQVALNDAASNQNTVTTPAPASNQGSQPSGVLRAGVLTEDSTKIIPFIIIGVVALAAIVAAVVMKIRKRKGDQQE